MNILDDVSAIKKLDASNMLGSIEALGAQMEQMWAQHKNFKLPANYKKIKNVVVAGMGGSALPAHVLKSLSEINLSVPLEIISDYNLPGYANANTLVILSSYSGSTEEPVALAKQAIKRKCKIVVVATGKNFAKMHESGTPGIIFDPKYNPCGSPRMGLGYQFIGLFLIFQAVGLLKFTLKDFNTALAQVKKSTHAWGVGASANAIKKIAAQLPNRAVLFFAADHLKGNAHVAANQMNENSKRLTAPFYISELNHHLMEGLRFPSANRNNLLVVIFNSKLYSPKIQERVNITKTVIEKNKVPLATVNLTASTKLEQIFEALVASSFLGFYGSMLEGIDPTPIPYVDYFKEQLAKK